jgi:deoxyribodipyrimidine photolyase
VQPRKAEDRPCQRDFLEGKTQSRAQRVIYFNPSLQTEKFDKKAEYIRKWVPEFDSLEYPQPIVSHELARKRCLDNYAKFLKKNS